jgi:hypothetical protein
LTPQRNRVKLRRVIKSTHSQSAVVTRPASAVDQELCA